MTQNPDLLYGEIERAANRANGDTPTPQLPEDAALKLETQRTVIKLRALNDAEEIITNTDPANHAPWEPPEPLAEGCTEPFPIDALPAGMAAAITEIADELIIDPVIPATAFLGAASALVGAHTRLTIAPGWTRRCNLYIGAIADTGDAKTPSCKPAWEPVRAHDQEIRDKAEHERRKAKLIIPRLKKQLTEREKAGAPVNAEDLMLQNELEEHERALTRSAQGVVDDVTPEMLAALLHDNNGIITALNDEGSLIRHLLGLYSDNANLDPWLKGWDQNPLTIDRKGGGQRASTSIHIPEPTLTVAALVQPLTIREMGTPKHKHLIDRGVLARMLVAWPISKVGTRFMAGRQPVPRTATPAWNRRITELAGQDTSIALTPDAHQRLMEWRDGLEAQLPVGKVYADIRPFAAKAPDQAARLAGLFAHLEGSPTVNPEHIDRGTRLADYYLRHAVTIAEAWHGAPIETARRILGKIIRQEQGLTADGFKVSDVARATRIPTDQIIAALEILEAHRYLRPADIDAGFGDSGRRVGKKSPRIHINPHLHKDRGIAGIPTDTGAQPTGHSDTPRNGQHPQNRAEHTETPVTTPLSPVSPVSRPLETGVEKRGVSTRTHSTSWDTGDSGVQRVSTPRDTTQRGCADCGTLVPAGRVRCEPCKRNAGL